MYFLRCSVHSRMIFSEIHHHHSIITTAIAKATAAAVTDAATVPSYNIRDTRWSGPSAAAAVDSACIIH